jgi:hypothetical protein
MAALSLGVRLVVLGLNAYLLYWWFKRDRRLDRLGWAIRISAILAGALLFAIGLHVGTYQNQESVLRYVVLPAAVLAIVFVFFADASYFLAQGLKRLTGHLGSNTDVNPESDAIDQFSVSIRAAGIGLGLTLCFSALYLGNFQNQVRLNRFLLIPGAGIACLFAFLPIVPDYLSRIVRRWLSQS